jgi:hypothetical protein
MPEGERLGLAEAVAALRKELTAAMTAGAGERVRFELGTVEMEFELELAKERGGEAGVKFWVVTLGGKGSTMSGSTHRVSLQLTPRGPDGGALGLISDTDTDPSLSAPSSAGPSGSMGDRE